MLKKQFSLVPARETVTSTMTETLLTRETSNKPLFGKTFQALRPSSVQEQISRTYLVLEMLKSAMPPLS